MSFFGSLFGPSKDDIWQQFSQATGGEFSESTFGRGSRVDARHGEWMVTLDTFVVSTGKSVVVFTRMRAPYVNPDGFSFNIYRKGIFSDIGKWMGMQDVEVGYPEFDGNFVIKGNDEGKLKRLFSNERIRSLLSAQPNIRFCVKDDENKFWSGSGFPQGVDELYFQTGGIIKDVDRLKQLYDLFSETLDELCRMGSAYNKSPCVTL